MQNDRSSQEVRIDTKSIARLILYISPLIAYIFYKISRVYSEPLDFRFGMMKFLFLVLLLPILFIIIHELIHVLTLFILTKCKFSDFKIGLNLKFMVVYISPKIDIPANKYKVVLMMPLLFLLPLALILYIWILPGMISSILLTIAILGSGYDLIWYFKLLKYNDNYLIMKEEEVGNSGLLNIKKIF
ncbi:MAG: metalloprotease family protein [bacterium]|nr:metalloprotease family protein [bacterium]